MSKKPVYAIIRYDNNISIAKEAFSVVKVFMSIKDAELEVGRLNRLNGDRTTEYYWQTSRLMD